MTTPHHLLPSAHTGATAALVSIERTVADTFGVRVDELHQRCREQRIVWPRQVAMWLMWRTSGASSTEVSAYYGMDHSTVIKATIAVENRMECYPDVKAELEALRAKVEGL